MVVSVIIPCYNYEKFVEFAIESVFNQTHKDIECIVVNDGSTDNTSSLLKNLKENKFADLIVINKENGGLSSARNTGIKNATGDFIAFLDADDLWTKDKLKNQLEFFKHNDVDIVYSDYVEIYGDKISDHKETTNVDNPTVLDFIAYNPCRASASSVILKREVVEKIGLFDTKLQSVEDLDYWFRCSFYGYKFGFCKHKDVILRRHTESMMKNDLTMFNAHHAVLTKQLSVLEPGKFKKSEYVNALRTRLGKMRWYSGNINRKDLAVMTHLLGLYYCGIRYFNFLILRQLVKDLCNLIFKNIAPIHSMLKN